MILSMTGFGKAVVEAENKRVTIEIRSVNGKQSDISMKVQASLRSLEMEMRKRVNQALLRGKIDVFITLEDLSNLPKTQVDAQLMNQYWKELQRISSETGIPMPQDPMRTLLSMPNIYISNNNNGEEETYESITMEALEKAIAAHISFRTQEGEALAKGFQNNIEKIRGLLAEVEPYEKERIDNVRAKLEEGLQKYIETDYDKNRLEQELIYYIEKLDINEEKSRLSNHLNYFIKTMESDEEGVGRKLGFIAQEIGREINTLGSKSNHSELQKIVVKMKDELEQIKEQVLNVL
ncbi:YicC/YloC family endoribonuclease [Porphyromonas sp.]|uniref:YicC/YloC family endoribonuclease n=1 Tax=Porphyromonas sp. TaxID=1924944 RepID=UPI0026DD1084|nr:YicC/YloC family endoribonuclease [Porphyromonas sp.]MDO4695278.1 YicC/YloC family endoribonuclease [Porphyromonas sp.]MDO4770684.1 YicC/YloC family endoribonuclease [Porphyromonas sp.]